jgi:hypothetical protein
MGNRVLIIKNGIVVFSSKFLDDINSQALMAGLLSDPKVIEVNPISDIGLGWTYDGTNFKMGQ